MSQYKFLLKAFTCISLVLIFWKASQLPISQKMYLSDEQKDLFELFSPVQPPSDFVNFNNSICSEDGEFIVPDYVHFIRFGENKMTFIDAVCILAALKHHSPDTLFIHTDQLRFDKMWGKYWGVVKRHPLATRIKVKFRPRPEEIFGHKFNEYWLNWHSSDVARLQVLMEFGGTYLDNDCYIVRNLDGFRCFEMTLGWPEGGNIANQAIMAHRNARFLKLWFESYREYNSSEWNYNAIEKPTEGILAKSPYLIHRLKELFAEMKGIPSMIYLHNDGVWRNHYVIHLLVNHLYMFANRSITSKASYPVIFDERNILMYDVNIKQMVLDVYPFEWNE